MRLIMSLAPVLILCADSLAADTLATGKSAPGAENPPPVNPGLAGSETPAGAWHLVHGEGKETETQAILHTPEFERSDPQLAGLMLRCGQKGIETIVVVVEPYSPETRPEIVLRSAEREIHFEGRMIPTGAGIRLPDEAANWLTQAAKASGEVEIEIAAANKKVDGVVGLTGLPSAVQPLNSDCVQK